jgi:polar amino acid transport system permease protein
VPDTQFPAVEKAHAGMVIEHSPIFAAAGWELLALYPPGWGGNLLRGLLSTIIISAGAYALGIAIGLCGAMGKLNGGPILKGALEAYTTLVRAVPELVLILLLFYAGNDLLNQALAALGYPRYDINGLIAGIYVLGFVQGAYSTEVLRGAIQAIPVGQLEAARAYGMTPWQRFTRVILPAMLPNAIPGMANLWLNVTKDSALLAVVGFGELMLETRQAAGSTKAYFMFYCAAALLYLMLTQVSLLGFKWLERRQRRGQAKLA